MIGADLSGKGRQTKEAALGLPPLFDTNRIILTRGLQGSGKTTWANSVASADDRYARVNRDDIRLMVSGHTYGGTIDEDLVTKIETEAVMAILAAGRVPIVDATHLYQRHINRWQKLGYPIEISEFSERLDVLLARNAARGETVPPEVIERNFKKFARADTGDLTPVKLDPASHVTSAFKKVARQPLLPEAFIVDIDGTLAHMNGRSPYDYTKVQTDTVDTVVRDVVNALGMLHRTIVVSGRKSECRAETEKWLLDSFVDFDELHMRADGDNRPDTIVKYEILRDEIAPRFDVLGVFDDRPSVCRMWRAVGITTFQVGDPRNEF